MVEADWLLMIDRFADPSSLTKSKRIFFYFRLCSYDLNLEMRGDGAVGQFENTSSMNISYYNEYL